MVHRQTTVLDGDNQSVQVSRDFITLDQFSRSSSGMFEPQYKSSVNLATMSFWRWLPRMQHMSTSSAASDPGMTMAQHE